MLLLVAVIRDLGRGIASKVKETITILRDCHSPLLKRKELLLKRKESLWNRSQNWIQVKASRS